MEGGTTAARTSLWRLPGMQALVGATTLGFSSFALTVASLPAYAVAGGTAEAAAGVVTAVLLLVTIAVQGLVPALTVRFGLGPVLAGGLLALGAPAPLYAVDDGLGWLAAISAVRGVGFAVLTVLGAVLAARIAPVAQRGESIGIYGLAIAVPNMLAVPAGVALVLAGHVGWLAWLAAAPVLAVLLVPRLVRNVRGDEPEPVAGAGRTAAVAAVGPSVVLFAVTLAGGGLVTFLPIERPAGSLATTALLAFGVTGALARWRAGMLADRLGGRLLLPLALAVAAGGLAVVALGLPAGDAIPVVAGAAVFGVGFGAVQNLTLLAAFARAGEGGTAAASAVWNAAFDAGTAAGALLVGFVAAGVGLPWTYAAVAITLAVLLPVARATAESTRRR